MRGHEGRIPIGNRHVRRGVFDLLAWCHLITEFLQGTGNQQGLETFFRVRALQGLHLDALAGGVGSESTANRQRGGE